MKTVFPRNRKQPTSIFNEADSMIKVCTYNTALKKEARHRVTKISLRVPDWSTRRKRLSDL